METNEPRRPWWKWKRWVAALLLWLVLPVAYPLSEGPAAYCDARGWISPRFYATAYRPLWRGWPHWICQETGQWEWVQWWSRLAQKHIGKALP